MHVDGCRSRPQPADLGRTCKAKRGGQHVRLLPTPHPAQMHTGVCPNLMYFCRPTQSLIHMATYIVLVLAPTFPQAEALAVGGHHWQIQGVDVKASVRRGW